MAKRKPNQPETDAAEETAADETPETAENAEPAETAEPQNTAPEQETAGEAAQPEQEAKPDSAAAQDDKYLRLLAEYDNFRKRSAKEKDAIWADSKASTAAEFLSVYDNLERALKAPCSDEAFLKGVELTMKAMKDVLTKLGIEEIPALGETFDPALHNAVMHVEDDSVGENTIVDVFQTGFQSSGKVVRFSMVKVAN